jgi:phage baseplate assembly protein W
LETKFVNKYIKLPIKFESITERHELNRCELKESIAQYIHLITTSYLGECRFDPTFGCSIWEFDFDNSMSDLTLKDNLRDSLTNAIINNEKRLTKIEVTVRITQSEITAFAGKRIKKKIDIQINAKIVKTNEAFNYFEYFFLGPLSYN